MIIRVLLAAAIAAPCVGCASVTRGTTENISISSTPAGATAEITGLEIPTTCVTPCVVQAKRNADITVTVNKEGYEPQIIPLTKEIPGTGAAGFAGNVLLGGLVGMGGRRRHRRRNGSQPESGHRDPATGRAAGPPATAAKTDAAAPELTGFEVPGAGSKGLGTRSCRDMERGAVRGRGQAACNHIPCPPL
jgi:hypothetical protein